MKVKNSDMKLYVITTREFLGNNNLKDECEEILQSGATFLQLREKDISNEEYIELGLELQDLASKYGIPFVINDNIEVAIKCNADGIHVGQSDMRASEVRSLIGEDKILGVSVQNVEQAKLAVEEGADYLGIGPVFATITKPDAEIVELDEVSRIKEAVNVPILVLGGIDDKTIYNVVDSKTDGIAVVSHIFASDNKKETTQKLRKIANELFK